jgi:hypothetical protein
MTNLNNPTLKPGDTIIASDAKRGTYSMHTITGTSGNMATTADSPYWDTRTAIEHKPGTTAEGFDYTHIIHSSLKWMKRDMKASKSTPVNIIGHYSKEEAAERNIHKYYAALHEAHDILTDGGRMIKHANAAAPLNQYHNNPHVVDSEQAVDDIMRCLNEETSTLAAEYDKATQEVAYIIDRIAQQDEKRVNAYMDKVRASKVEPSNEFIYLQDGIVGTSNLGVMVGDILRVATHRDWEYMQVTGGNSKKVTLNNLSTGEASTLTAVSVHDDEYGTYCQPGCDYEFHYNVSLQLSWEDGTVIPVFNYTILPSHDLELVNDYRNLITGQCETIFEELLNFRDPSKDTGWLIALTSSIGAEVRKLSYEDGNIFRIQNLKDYAHKLIKREREYHVKEAGANQLELWGNLQAIAEFNK